MKNKFFATIVVLSLSSLFVMLHAVPAYSGWRIVEQPDGTRIELRLIGDEFYHYWVNRAGEQMVKNEEGYFVVAPEQLTVAQRKARVEASPRRRNAVAPRKAPAIQPTKLLVILVNFSDKTMTKVHNNAFFSDMLNKTGFSPSGCVSEYFKASSDGKYVPQFDVYGPVTLDRKMSYYGANDKDGNDMHPDQMVVDACAKVYAQGCDFSKYDTDNDGTVDNIYVIYAGYGEAAGASANTIWPHSWEIYEDYVEGTLKYNGKWLGHYACSAELSGSSGTQADGVGTFAHEFSHVIGMPDYYDTNYGSNYNNNATPGDYTLMDGGSYNNNGQTPPLYSIFDKYLMGWADCPALLAKNAKEEVVMPVGTQYARHITGTTTPASSATTTNTVYYLENRQKSGWDAYLPEAGLLVWEVKYNQDYWDANEVNSSDNPSEGYYCEENTSGYVSYKLVGNAPKTSNYTPKAGCAITDITNSAGVVSFKYNGGAEDDSPIQLDVDYGWAEIEDGLWTIVVYKYATREPWVQFYFENGESNKIAGTYDLKDEGAKYWPDDSNDNYKIRSVSGTLTVTCVGVKTGESGYNEYAIAADFVADDGHEYIVNQTLELGGRIGKDDLELKDEIITTSLENISMPTSVRKYIKDGHLVIERDGVRYSVIGIMVQ